MLIVFWMFVGAVTCIALVAFIRLMIQDPGQVTGWDTYYRETERYSEPWGPTIRDVKPPPPQAFYYEDYDSKQDPEFLYHKWEVDRYIQWLRADRNRLQDELTRAQEVAKRVNKSLEGVL